MALSSVGMRMTPQRTTIVMKKNPVDLAEDNGDRSRRNHEFKTRSAAGEIAAGQVGMLQADDASYAAAEEEFGADVMCNEYGRPIVDREMAYLPDPRYSNGGHTVFALLWYGGFLLAIAYIAWVFVTYEPEQNSAVYMTSSLDPRVDVQLRFSCSGGGTTMVKIMQTYTPTMGGACYNASFPPPPDGLTLLAPSPLGAANAATITVPICDTPHGEYNPNDGSPELNGVFVKFMNITENDLCQIDVYPQLRGNQNSKRPIKRLSVENNVLKTFYMSYWRKREKHTSWFGTSPPTYTLLDERLVGRYYELDAARQYTGTAAAESSSVIAIRYHDTANDVTVYDMRSWVKAGGIFGTLWYMISAYACFWAAPLLICTFPRDLVAEAKAGKLDGYTDNALKDAWRPTVWLWIGGELIKRISYASK